MIEVTSKVITTRQFIFKVDYNQPLYIWFQISYTILQVRHITGVKVGYRVETLRLCGE